MSSTDSFEELVPMYALGALPADERKVLEAHLKECASCRRVYREQLQAVNMLPQLADLIQPSPDLKRKLFARVDADLAQAAASAQPSSSSGVAAVRQPVPLSPVAKQSSPFSWLFTPRFAFVAVAAVLILAAGILLLSQFTQSPEQREIASILSNPNVQQREIKGTAVAPTAQGTMHMVPGANTGVLTVSGLQALPGDKTYEFWLIKGAAPVPAGLFAVDPNGNATLLVKGPEQLALYDKLGVTIEPHAGVAKPSGTLVLQAGF